MEILVVDDDSISCNILRMNLTKLGYTIHTARNGRAAIESLGCHDIRMVLTDWVMPEMDGIELCRYIRGNQWNGYIYLIVITSRDRTQEDLLAVFNAGADDYLTKPFLIDELKARVAVGNRLVSLENHHLKMQDLLKESRNKLRVVFDAMELKIATLNRSFDIVSGNKAFANQLQMDETAIAGMNCEHLLHPEIIKRVEKVFQSQAKEEFLFEAAAADAKASYSEIVLLPIVDSSEKIIHVVLVEKDVTELHYKNEEVKQLNVRLIENAQQLKQKNSKLKEALKKLEETQSHMLQSEKMASIGQLAAGVAHEINNPTGFVSSNLKTLSGYNTDILGLVSKYRELHAVLSQAPENSVSRDTITAMLSDIHSFEEQIDLDYLVTDITELIEDCREGTGRIKKIVADLKDFAHPGNEQLQLVDINKGLDTTLNVVNNEIKYKATVKKQYGDLPLILGFPQQLNQVFMNILVNAAQAIEEKGDITVVTQTEDGYIEVNIADTGSGIEKKNLPKIFEPFFTTKDVGKGTGLGMHIAFNIIQKHKGTISVASEVGKGTQFKIRLPIPVEGEGN